MVRAFKNEDGLAYVTRFNRETEEKEDFVISEEPYTGVSWISKDERVLATVHTNHIRVFSIPSLEEIYAIPTNSEVEYGCLSFDGQFLAFKDGDDYQVHNTSSQSLISNVTFTKGSNCWVNSEALFVQESVNHVHKFIHGSSEAAMKFDGRFAVEQSDGEMFFLESYFTGEAKKYKFRLRDCGNNVLLQTNHIRYVVPISADISSNYLMFSESCMTMVYNRSNGGSLMWEGAIINEDIERVEAGYISPDEEHFTVVANSGIGYICDVEGEIVATVPSHCTGPTVSYDIVEDYLIKANTPLGSFFCCGLFSTCEENYFIKKVENGCLCFFSSRIAYIYKENCITKKHDPHNGVIVNVTKDADSVFHVELDDGTFMMVEWTEDDGFGRIVKCNSDRNNYGNAIDTEIEISELYSRISEQKLELDTKFERQKSEMDMKFQVTFDTLSQLVPNSGNKEYSELTKYVDDCAAAIRQLEMPLGPFFKWMSSNPKVQTFDQHLGELELAIDYVHSLESIIVEFELGGSLSNTFCAKFSDLVAQFPIAKVLNESAYSLKLSDLQGLDDYFKIFDKCVELQLTEVYSALISFKDKNKALKSIVSQSNEIGERVKEFREAQVAHEEVDVTIDFDLIYSLQEQLDRHHSDISEYTGAHFVDAKAHLLDIVESNAKQLKDTICEFSLAVNLNSTLVELRLSSIRFPSVPKIISYDNYLNGDLEEIGLQNDTLVRDDLFIKCICVSERFRGDRDMNLKALRRELRVLTKLYPCVVSLKNVVLVPEMKKGSTTVKFVCLELERAPYDLEQFLSAFPDLDISTRNSVAHQLVMAVFMMHANGIILRDLKPQNVLVYCGEDASNPKIKLCDFGVSIDNSQTMGGNTIVGTFGYIAREVTEGQPHTFLSDIFALGKTISYIYAQNRTDVSNLVLRDDCAHSEIIQRCQAHDSRFRPSIYELSCNEWRTVASVAQDRLALIRRQINQFVVTKQALLRDNEREASLMEFVQEEHFDQFFVRIFSNASSFMNGIEHFGASVMMHGMEKLSIPQFVDHIFEHRALPSFDADASDDLIEAMCGFLYCCFVFHTPVDDVQVGHFVLNALSRDFDKLSDAAVFDRVFVTESAYILNMLNHEGLNFSCFGGEDKLVTAENINAFLQIARDMVSGPWAELSRG
ncbi:hypothetical protein PCE1_002325 [Barthelona sp. PCE]